jgi:hypothetical protein
MGHHAQNPLPAAIRALDQPKPAAIAMFARRAGFDLGRF